MGTLIGHVLPGSFFLLFSLWRVLQISHRLRIVELLQQRSTSLRRSKSRAAYVTSASYPCCFERSARWPVEGAMKILVTAVGMAGELYASTDYGRAGQVKWLGDLQHLTMYSMFCLSGIVDVLRWKKLRFCPPGLDFLVLANAFIVEWLVFSNHLHGRNNLDVTLHTLLLYIIAATVLTVLLEYKFDKSLMTSLATTYLLFVQGAWFFQVGVILYVPSQWTGWLCYTLTELDQTLMATTIFAWLLGGAIFVLLLFFGLTRYAMRYTCQPKRLDIWQEVMGIDGDGGAADWSSQRTGASPSDESSVSDEDADDGRVNSASNDTLV